MDVYDFDGFVEQAAEAARKGDAAVERLVLAAASELYQEELAREIVDEWLTPVLQSPPSGM